jgi:phage FluMu protein Com
MCCMERYLLLEIRELRHLGIECSRCKTTTVFSIDNEHRPLTCPSCEKPFYEKTQDNQNPICLLADALEIASARAASGKDQRPRITVHVQAPAVLE